MNLRECLAWAALSMALVVHGSPLAAQATIPSETRARLLLQTLGFDQGLSARGALRIAVLYFESTSEIEGMPEAFEAQGAGGIQGLAVSAVPHRFTDVRSLMTYIQDYEITALYVPLTLARALSSVQQVSRGRKIISFTEGRALVEQGISLGVVQDGEEFGVAVNLRSAAVEGIVLTPGILGRLDVIR